ncbi:GNAT family N-acetyltransferase [Paenibacillus puldeungensis]|uniref:GNAT family N-acetyltransferase n=1 Tax=Paenibacillus puldeungensis TaxID=696536 RepID=A0ABW3RWG5_9BACL
MKIRQLENAEEAPLELLLMADPSEKIVREYLKRGSCYIATVSHEIVGVFVLLKTRPETVEIVNIAVREDYQRKGIGTKLVIFATERAKEERAKTIEIGTGNSSIGQLLLYQKCGYRLTGIDRDFFVRHYSEEIFENGIQCRDMVRLSLEI